MTTFTTDKIDGYIQKFLDGLAEGHRQLEVSFAASKAEYDAKMAESDAKMRRGFAKLRRSQQKTEKANRIGFEELRKIQRKTENNFNTQWGRLVEALVNNQVIPLLAERGIPVHRTRLREKGCIDGHNYEFDIIAENGDTIVVIEVKTTLRSKDVHIFLKELRQFKQWLPRYSDMKIYGAVAFLHCADDVATFAEKKGFFTILATGSSATITNPPEFQPKEF